MYEYNDGLRPAGRHPRLWLARGGEVRRFSGMNIPGFCAVVALRREKCGKWSSTTYTLDLAPGVRPLYFLSRMHGTWGEDLRSWGEVAEKLGLPVGVAREVVRAEYKGTAERLDRLEDFALAIEAEGFEAETVVVAFGGPTREMARQGFWDSPKSAQTSDGRRVTVEPSQGEYGADWDNPVVVEPEGAKILSSHHDPGMAGGYYTIEVIVPVASAS